MTVDAEGFVWSAQWYGEQVVRYDPDGAVERRIPMPVQQVSCVMFGGPDLTDLHLVGGLLMAQRCGAPRVRFQCAEHPGSVVSVEGGRSGAG